MKRNREITKYRSKKAFIDIRFLSKLIPGFLFVGCVLLTPGISFSNIFDFNFENDSDNTSYFLAQVQTVDVPDLRGMRYEAVRIRRLLRQSGLRLGNIENIPDNSRIGEIIDQDPDPGSVVPYDSQVNIRVGAQQPIETVSRIIVPDLTGKTEESARETLTQLKLNTGEVMDLPSDGDPGLVARQFPVAGAVVQTGTEVNLYISVRKMVEVQNLINKNLEEAQGIINELGLKVGTIKGEKSRRETIVIISQSILPGTMVEKGTSIDLTYSIPDQKIIVPDVKGIPIDKARMILARSGLPVESVSEKKSDEPTGVVLIQIPEAGSNVSPGTDMKLIISSPNASIPPWIYWGGGVLLAVVAGAFIRKITANKIQVTLKFEPSVDVGKQKVKFCDDQTENKSIRVKAIPDPGIQLIKKNYLI